MSSIAADRPPSAGALTAAMCAAQVLGMLAFAVYSANVPGFIAEWGMSNTEAGWLGGVFSFGNLLGIPVLVTLTDRFDARRIWLGSMVVMGIGHLGFALFAEGLWSAMFFRGLSGIGFAGTYIPGLRLLSEHLTGPAQARGVTLYSAGTGLGGATSFFMAGLVLGPFGWSTAYAIGAVGCVVAVLVVLAVVPPARRPVAVGPRPPFLNLRPVVRNRPALAYVLANMGHNFENYGARAWTVAFLVFAMSLQGIPGLPLGLSAPMLMAAIVLAGSLGGYLGGTLGERFGRRPVALVVVVLSLFAALLAGVSPIWPFAIVFLLVALHSVTMTMDNGVLNAGALAASPPELRGATMAVYGFFGFIGAMLGPTVFGLVLDVAGSDRILGWALAFGSLGLAGLLGAIGLALLRDPAAR
ncbi:MAG: MFS transporter [Alphaproteobacteria bacterium]